MNTKEMIEEVMTEYYNGGFIDSSEARENLEELVKKVVKKCADYADMAYDARCEYPGDYVAEGMGYGVEEGVTAWRAK
jgi:hypothetical protein